MPVPTILNMFDGAAVLRDAGCDSGDGHGRIGRSRQRPGGGCRESKGRQGPT
jgi:hypothetical protein